MDIDAIAIIHGLEVVQRQDRLVLRTGPQFQRFNLLQLWTVASRDALGQVINRLCVITPAATATWWGCSCSSVCHSYMTFLFYLSLWDFGVSICNQN
jgi:hypothetical protein